MTEEGTFTIFLDDDFATDKACKYHCSPSCHPAQVGPDWRYGCTHMAWPQNRNYDFVPIVDCDGEGEKCELKNGTKYLSRFQQGRRVRIANALRKIEKWRQELEEIG